MLICALNYLLASITKKSHRRWNKTSFSIKRRLQRFFLLFPFTADNRQQHKWNETLEHLLNCIGNVNERNSDGARKRKKLNGEFWLGKSWGKLKSNRIKTHANRTLWNYACPAMSLNDINNHNITGMCHIRNSLHKKHFYGF